MSLSQNKTIALNSVYIFLKLAITSVISLIASRWVLDALGQSDYGLFNVIGGVVVILNVFNTAMITTTYRYIAYELGITHNSNVNKVFSASILIHFVLSIVILVVGLFVGLWYVNNILNLDSGNYDDARFILIVSVVTTSISTLFVPFQGLLVAYEKFHISAIIEVFSKILFIAAVYYLLCKANYGVRIFSLIQLTIIAISSLAYYYYCRVKYKNIIKFNIIYDKKLYKEMTSFTGWTLIGASSYIGQTQGSSTVLNYFFGTSVNAAFAVANQIENFISMFARNLSQAAIPQITKSYSGGDNDRSIRLTGYISKYTFFLMSIVAFPLLLEMDFVLGVWLKSVPYGASLFCKLLIINGLANSLNSGIPSLIQATGKIKVFQIIGSSLSLLSIPISIVLYSMGTMPQTIIIVFTITSFLNLIVGLFLLKQILHIDIVYFFKISYSKVIVITLFLILCYFIYNPCNYTLAQHLSGLCITELYLFVVLVIFGLDRHEKELIKQFIKAKIFNRQSKN